MKIVTTAALTLCLALGAADGSFAQATGEESGATDAGAAGQADSGSTPDAAAVSPADASGVLAPISKEDAPVPQLNLMVGQVDEMKLIGADGQEVGEVDSVLGDANGNAMAITVEVGGFLGIGEKTVVLMLSDVSLDMGRIQTKLTKEQIEKLPAFGG
ncbi:PRC-barrel domain-containing protein [Jiella sp. KSK16Y-1]|uniref:PRC-barrel domain-containing protein n=1 Tax=Jiella mangrovi TaxID=2821407 RepID=A0ABS4BC95_9HYPH|nr:PRC-barrel domain-containing protein [Jiella mangrovi]